MKAVFLSEYPAEDGAPFTGSHLQVHFIARLLSGVCDSTLIAFDYAGRGREYREGNLKVRLLRPSRWEVVRLFRVLRTLLEEDPRVVYTRGRNYHLIAGFAAKILKGSLLVWGVNAQGGYRDFKYVRDLMRSRRPLLRKVVLLPMFLLLDLGVAMGMRASDVITVQNTLQMEAVKGKFPGKRVFLLPNLQEVSDVRVPSPVKGPYFVWASARKGGTKRPEDFIRMASSMPYARFVMVGMEVEGPDNLISFPRLPRGKLHAVFREALAIVVTSSPESEGIPNVVIEAMLLGVPVVSVGDDFGFLRRGGGVVVGSVDEAIRVLDHLWKDRDYASRLSKEAKELATSLFVEGAKREWTEFWNRLKMEACSS